MKTPLWWIKLTHFEYWPYWIFYLPMLPYGIWLSIRAGSFSYFTAVNPGMHMGGLLNSSKWDVLSHVPTEYVPHMIKADPTEKLGTVHQRLQDERLTFPLVAKPDKGERGKGVEKISSIEDLVDYMRETDQPFLLQEFIDWEHEIGVFYSKHPEEEKGQIRSVVVKGFLEIEGDGTSTLEHLMFKNPRARFREKYLRKKFDERLSEVLPQGQKIRLEPIGNHNRGTAFLNGNHLINEQLHATFDQIASQISGYCYGRFDLKAKSIEDLYQGKNIKFMELNGINSEPAHIYAPGYPFWKAMQDIRWHMKRAWRISVANRKSGANYATFTQLYGEIWIHLRGGR